MRREGAFEHLLAGSRQFTITLRRSDGFIEERFAFPPYRHYDVLRGLDYFRAAGAVAGERMREAIELVVSKHDEKGWWRLDLQRPGQMHFAVDEGEGMPSRWNTLRALRILRWYERVEQVRVVW